MLCSIDLLGQTLSQVVEKFKAAESEINSGVLNVRQIVVEVTELLKLASTEVRCLGKVAGEIGTLFPTIGNDIKEGIYYNLFRLCAFPTEPSTIRDVLDDLFRRTIEISDAEDDKKTGFGKLIQNLPVGKKAEIRFRKIVSRQLKDYLGKAK